MAQTIEVTLPDIGDFQDVEIIEILVKAGDVVSKEDPLLTLESDKASMEIPSPQAGTVDEVNVALGDRISQGDLIVTLVAAPTEAPASPASALSDDTTFRRQAVARISPRSGLSSLVPRRRPRVSR